jgi:outer membrane immunogenic protein
MRRWSVAVIAAISAIAFGQIASAADMRVKAPVYKAPPQPAVYNWQGFYLGGHIGYIWSRTDVFDTGVLIESGAKTNGWVGGLLAGYNWQANNIVFGLEGDFGWSNAHGHGLAQVVVNPNSYDIDWTGHLRGRIGIVPGSAPLLVFVAGGAAFSRFVFTDGETGESSATTYTGASLGAGLDFAATNQILLRAEWLHDFYGMSAGAVIHDYTAKLQNTDTARAAFIFKFN